MATYIFLCGSREVDLFLHSFLQARLSLVCAFYTYDGYKVTTSPAWLYLSQLSFSISECSLSSLFFQSKSSLEMMESQSCDAEPPPPPKPELRYPGITRGNTEGNAVCLPATAQKLSTSHLRVNAVSSCCHGN